MRDVTGYERTTVLAAVIALVGVAGHYANAHSLPMVPDEWSMILSVATFTIIAVAIRRRRPLELERHPTDAPVWQHVRTKMRVEVDRGLVPVQHGPL